MSKCVWRNSRRDLSIARARAVFHRLPANARRGLTLVEVVVSTLIVGMMTVAALNGLGAATRSSEATSNRGVAQGLADALMAEILATAYEDPSGNASFGREAGENPPRGNFDDVDDFHGWNEKPPRAADGAVIPNRARFRQRIAVTRVVPGTPNQATPGNAEQGAKQIVVTIEFDDIALATEYAIVTNYRGQP